PQVSQPASRGVKHLEDCPVPRSFGTEDQPPNLFFTEDPRQMPRFSQRPDGCDRRSFHDLLFHQPLIESSNDSEAPVETLYLKLPKSELIEPRDGIPVGQGGVNQPFPCQKKAKVGQVHIEMPKRPSRKIAGPSFPDKVL